MTSVQTTWGAEGRVFSDRITPLKYQNGYVQPPVPDGQVLPLRVTPQTIQFVCDATLTYFSVEVNLADMKHDYKVELVVMSEVVAVAVLSKGITIAVLNKTVIALNREIKAGEVVSVEMSEMRPGPDPVWAQVGSGVPKSRFEKVTVYLNYEVVELVLSGWNDDPLSMNRIEVAL